MSTPRSKETLGKDMEAVVKACQKRHKFAVTVGVGAEMFKLCVTAGFHMIAGGGDVPFLANSSKQISSEAREIINGMIVTPVLEKEPTVNSPY